MPSFDAVGTMIEELRQLGFSLRIQESLARHGTFAVGGPAEVWINIQQEAELSKLVTAARDRQWPLMLVGNGTNILYADAGARGIVARMIMSDWSLEEVDENCCRLTAGAGISLPRLVNELAKRGWAGLEWGAGVPGTIGGAIVSNAGAHGACTADTLQSVTVLSTSGGAGEAGIPVVRTLLRDDLDFAYRHSRFRAGRRVSFDDDDRPVATPRELLEPPEMILGGIFLLRRAEPSDLQARVNAYRQHRKDTQPVQASAGSVFKNPPGDYSGRLIEAAGLKGATYGRAQISPLHANFIVNPGGASAADIVGLITLARRTVRGRFGVELELELELRGDW
jgi:UDP-N-acetylmuramate dehydrogenase